jgi:hypothetical protein
MGGQEVNTASEYGESFDHFAVDFEFPNGVHIQSMARQIANCESEVAEHLVGTKGKWHSSGYRFEGVEIPRFREREVNPYVQEHIDLLASIESSKPLNELEQVANSTLTAILGRLSAYTGKAVTWDQALNSQWNTFPETLAFGPRPPIQIAKPGVTELV